MMTAPPQNSKPFQFQLDLKSGVPVYRQIIDQVLLGIASGALPGGAQLPTVRQMAVDLSVNPNTVVRAYRELEIRGILTTQQGTGTFITPAKVTVDEVQRRRRLARFVADCASRAGGEGFSVQEVIDGLKELQAEKERTK